MLTKIAPFKAVVYNQEKIKDLSKVVCPPYDVISRQKQEYYHNLDPHNLIHMLLGKDTPEEDKYRRAARYFKDWLKGGVLIEIDKPAIFFYSQEFKVKGEKRLRLGFIALLKLEDKNTNIFAHEHTRLEPKEDRLSLLRQVKANLSPIFAVFSDHDRIIQRIYRQHADDKKAMLDITDDDGVKHKLWKIDSAEIIDKIQSIMQNENIFIADGHHRYEVACNFREELKKKLSSFTGEEPFNYIMAYFTHPQVPGLTIMPIHRKLLIDKSFDFAKFLSDLGEYFDVEEVKDKIKFFFLMQKAGNAEHVIGMHKEKKYWLLRLKNVRILDKVISDKKKEYRALDVSILNYLILKKILGLDIEDKERILYNHDAQEIIKEMENSGTAIAFFLNPVKIEQIMAVALSGEKMPSKSTYFYPKVLSGLVINKF